MPGAVAWVGKDESGEYLLHVIGRAKCGARPGVGLLSLGVEVGFELLLQAQRKRMRLGRPRSRRPYPPAAGAQPLWSMWLRCSIAKRRPCGSDLPVNMVRTSHAQSLMAKLGVALCPIGGGHDQVMARCGWSRPSGHGWSRGCAALEHGQGAEDGIHNQPPGSGKEAPCRIALAQWW